MNIAGMAMVCIGLFFLAVSAIGLIRLPDFYSRAHAVGKSETLGVILVLLGLALYNGIAISSLKLIIILIFIAIANPTATNAIARAAYMTGLTPWLRKDKNNHADTDGAEDTGT